MTGGRAERRKGGRPLWWIVLFFSAVPPVRLSAQTIDTVIVWNRNIFDSEDDAPGFIPRVANALHIRTRASVIRRTLLLGPGDPYDSARVAESERALRALNVFRMVRVDTVRLGAGGRLALRAITADGWSSKPQASYSTAGGDETWEVAFVEGNFLGTASQAAVAYGKNPDRRRLEFVYVNPHFLWRRTTLFLRTRDLSDGTKSEWQFGVPFYQTAARWAFETYGESADERILMFRDAVQDSSPQRRALRAGVGAGIAAHATSRDHVRLLFGAEWRREDFAPDSTAPSPRSVFVTGRAGIEVGHVRFRVLEHVNSYGRREDIDLSQVLRVAAVVQSRLGVEARAQASAVWRGGFVVLRGEASAIDDSSRVRGGMTVVSQNIRRHTVIAHLEGGALHRPKPGAEFDLWLDQRGPRLFGAHEFTGTRTAWLALEDRILVADDVWGLWAIGVAPFLDYGGAWFHDEPSRLEGNAGLALRFGPTRAVSGQAAEIAIGYRFGGQGWGIALRKGFTF